MHGREQREEVKSYRWKNQQRWREILRRWKRVQHMRSVPASVTSTNTRIVPKSDSAIVSISSDSFSKDGRTISVGDCALFKPPQDSPPFVGIIRLLLYNKENSLQLGVNWLYRLGELKLGKGILLDAAPNEIFYSFHKDEIPAASLLHPCRVSFLPKGAELPLGISSFVCRRVYDIENNCVWWLTDRDYINERQEEVDQLLYKTRIEMHATVQPGGRSPKSINGPTSTSQLRPASDSVQNMTSFPSHGKGKKRERGDQGSDPVKRERSMKIDDGDYSQSRIENTLKSEIAKVTEKGRLVDSEGVQKFLHLMQPDKAVKKVDLIYRSMLAGVIAATDNFDCLNRFIQLRGLPVLYEWLQDAQKGRLCDGSSSKDGDKSIEEFLLLLLRALDKLPINLHALQTCNIGKSVNYLSKHKNLEIQKKAKSLVYTWKKRVEAEMNILDSKSGSNQTISWPSKSRLPESPCGGSRNSVGSGDVAARSSKVSTGEMVKSASSSPGPVKSTSPVSVKESQTKVTAGETCDLPLTTREDKNSISSQPHNYSLSGKEDAKGSTTGSLTGSKVSSSGSKHRKSMNGFPAASVSGGHKETSSSRSSSLQRISAVEKLSHCGLTGEKYIDVPVVEASNHRLIVKIPNKGRSPAHSTSAGSFEDPSIMSNRASSPVLSDKRDQFDCHLKDRSDAYRADLTSKANGEFWQSTNVKDVLTRSNDGDASPTGLSEQEQVRTDEDIQKVAEVSKAAASSSGIESKSRKLHAASFRSINALIDGCVKDSEADTSISVVDDVGMNLLATVAAGEMSKSDLVSSVEPHIKSYPAAEEACVGEEGNPKASSGENLVQDGCQPDDEAGNNGKKYVITSSTECSKDEPRQELSASPESSRDRKVASSSSEEKLGAKYTKSSNSSNMDLHTTADGCMETGEILDVMKVVSCLSKGISSDVENDGISESKLGGNISLVSEVELKDVKQKVEVMSVYHSSQDVSRNNISKSLNYVTHMTKRSPSVLVDAEVLPSSVDGKESGGDNVDEITVGGAVKEDSTVLAAESGMQRRVQDTNDENCLPQELSVIDQKRVCLQYSDKNKLVMENQPCTSPQNEEPAHTAQDVRINVDLGESKFVVAKGEDCTSAMAEDDFDTGSKVIFDLNEGFFADDVKCEDPVNVYTPACPSNIQGVHSLPFASSSVATSLPAPVTVAAAAKGPFVPPEDLLRNKGEVGWKGSAATSAFRPAEPRKAVQIPLASTNISPPDASTCKNGRAPLEFDLNVPDERILEDMVSQDSADEIGSLSDLRYSHDISHNEHKGEALGHNGGLDLDLNRTDEPCDIKPPVTSVKSSTPGELSTSEVRMDFDLNDGPSVDDASTEQSSFSQHARGNMHTQPPLAGLRISNADMGNLSTWFPPPGNSYSTVAIPTILPDRMQHPFSIIPPGAPQRILGPAGTFTPADMYRGSVLSSSPAVQFPSGPFQYPVYPFGSNFHLPSATFPVGSASSGGRLFTPHVNSQLLGPVDTISSHYPRPYLVSLTEGTSVSSGENGRRWSRQGFDLNAGHGHGHGHGGIGVEGREEIVPISSSNQPAGSSSQSSLAVEQGNIYHPMGGGVTKRKEPDGGRDNDSFRYKQSSWQ